MTPNVYLVVLFFCFPLTLNNYSLASSIFFKILANGIVYFRACRRGIYTDLYLCMYVCVCVYMCVYMLSMQEIHLRFTVRFVLAKKGEKNDLISTFHCLFVIVPISTIDRASFYRVKYIGSIESCLKSKIR